MISAEKDNNSIQKTQSQIRGHLRPSARDAKKDIPPVYEVIRIKGGKPVFPGDHYDRLERSLLSLGRTAPFTYEEFTGIVHALIRDEKIRNHNIRVEVDIDGNWRLTLNPTHYPAPELYESGVRTDLFEGERRNPNIKMLDRTLRAATDEAIRSGDLFEVLLVDRNGNITEGSRSNVFFIRGDKVITPPSDKVLLGVTRKNVIRAIKEMGLELSEETVPADRLKEFDAAFISGTSPEVLPIAYIGDSRYDVKNRTLRIIMDSFAQLEQSSR